MRYAAEKISDRSYITRDLINSLEENLKAYKSIAQIRLEFKTFVYEIERDIGQVRKELYAKEHGNSGKGNTIPT